MTLQTINMQIPRAGRKQYRGFTIVELLVVISVIVIILGITIPRLNRSSQATRLRTTAENIVGLLETAKSYAAARHDIYEVFHNGSGRIYIQRNDPATGTMVAIDRGLTVPSGIAVSLTTDDVVRFTPFGTAESVEGTIIVTASSINKQRVIEVTPSTGYIRITS